MLLWDVDFPSPAVRLTISISPAVATSPRVGEQLTLSLEITAGEDLEGYQATVKFDPGALRFVEGAAGNFLPEDAFFVPPVLDENLVTFGGTVFSGAVKGDGILAAITFEVLAIADSSLTLSNVSFVNSSGERVYPAVAHAEIIAPPSLAGDVNGDGAVNILDLVQVAVSIGTLGENDADVNGDGSVDIRDLVLVAAAMEAGGAAAK